MAAISLWDFTKELMMKQILLFVGIFAVWYFLQAYLLPKLGVST